MPVAQYDIQHTQYEIVLRYLLKKRNSMSKTALLEIGVEELPPVLVQEALKQLEKRGKELFASRYLDYKKIITSGSSRRLIFLAEEVALEQKERIEKEMGPPERVVLNERGELTREGEAYLKAKGAKREDIGVEKLKKGRYVYIKRKIVGKKTEDILPSLFLELITSLHFSKSMRWNQGKFSFGRPIRSILALFGKEIVKFEVAGVKSNRKTRGHPYLSPSVVYIENPEQYPSFLKKKWVLINPAERREIILGQMKEIVSYLNKEGKQRRILEDEELLEEIVYSVEYPTLFWGEFAPHFLSSFPCIKSLPERLSKSLFCGRRRNIPALFRGSQGGKQKILKKSDRGQSKGA